MKRKATDETVLDAIEDFTAREGYSPSVRQIAAAVGGVSATTVWHRLQSLREDGRVSFRAGQPRTLRVEDVYR